MKYLEIFKKDLKDLNKDTCTVLKIIIIIIIIAGIGVLITAIKYNYPFEL